MSDSAAILLVDLGQQTSATAALSDIVVEEYLGGRGLGAYLLAQYLALDTDPFEPDNPLIFAVGPLQGTRAPFSSKAVVTTKSPLTGIYSFSIASGEFACEMARCGFLGLVIVGRAAQPTYLWIHNDQVDFRSADQFWEAQTSLSMRRIMREVPCSQEAIAVIGPAGTNRVRYANVITGGERMRAFGRAGAGAVMGSKHLKGIALQGDKTVQVADAQLWRETRHRFIDAIADRRAWAQRRRDEGTTTSMPILQDYGMLPTRNWQRGSFEGLARLVPSLHKPDDPWEGRSVSCGPNCPAPCARRYRVIAGEYEGAESNGPDYETVYALGSNCGIDRFDALVAADRLCDELGLDTISAGVTIAFAMECTERGWLPVSGNERAPSFGDHQAMVNLLQQIAHREGLGGVLAEGVRHSAQFIGHGSDSFAMHAKGLELGGWGCRGTYGQAIQYALGSRGGCHHDLGCPGKAEYALPEAATVQAKGEFVLHTGRQRIAQDSAMICSFAGQYVELAETANLLTAVTGRPLDASRLEQIGERVLNLERLLNVREGVDRHADLLPARLQLEPLPDGPRSGSVVPLESLKIEFYHAAAWDISSGIPTGQVLDRLGIAGHFPQLAAIAAARIARQLSEEEQTS